MPDMRAALRMTWLYAFAIISVVSLGGCFFQNDGSTRYKHVPYVPYDLNYRISDRDYDERDYAYLHLDTADYHNVPGQFRDLAEEGDSVAQFHLGLLYANGAGVVKNMRKAESWFIKSAEQNYSPAQYKLALMYLSGDGVPVNKVSAYMWLDIASFFHPSDKAVAKHRAELQKAMTPDEKYMAKKRINAWYERNSWRVRPPGVPLKYRGVSGSFKHKLE